MDWAVIQRRYPDMVSKDHEIMNRAWARFLNSEESLPYRVKPEGVRY
jgi:hypothetical protein